jgi:hypothetical protein
MNIQHDTELEAGKRYRIIQICETDINPSLKEGDIVEASDTPVRGQIACRPVDGWWFADNMGEDGFGTLVREVELVE